MSIPTSLATRVELHPYFEPETLEEVYRLQREAEERRLVAEMRAQGLLVPIEEFAEDRTPAAPTQIQLLTERIDGLFSYMNRMREAQDQLKETIERLLDLIAQGPPPTVRRRSLRKRVSR